MYVLIHWPQYINPFPLVALQSAAMEETVIWEQHTVTLHRVSFFQLFIPLSSFVFVLLCLSLVS